MSKLKYIFAVVLVAVMASLVIELPRLPLPPQDVEQRVDKILSRMTLEEKIDMISGVPNMYTHAFQRLGIPQLQMSDGPLGVHDYGRTTAYPAAIALAASWDTELASRVGEMMGRDARVRGVNIILGPGMDMYRAPMCGRNFEYFGEDPFLASRIAVSEIEGIQSQQVMATAKHFVANDQEYERNQMSADIDERTLREIYLPVFEASVREAHVGAIMDSYNLVNGEHMTQNGALNTEVVKNEWGFDGIMMSDWGATHDGIAAANGGLDLEMPSGIFMTRATLLPAIQQGKVSLATIDDKVRRILRKIVQFVSFDREPSDLSIPVLNQKGRKIAQEESESSMVLLKNEGNILPLDKRALKTIAVIGPDSYPAVIGGGGSSLVEPFSSVSYLEGVRNYLGSGVKVLYSARTISVREVVPRPEFHTGASGGESSLPAKEIAARADAVILCVGFDASTESEGADRTFHLPDGQDELIREISRINKNVIVVITAGGGVDMTGWIDAVPAILHAWYPGQEGGSALARILFGEVSPSGKLPASFERRWEDNPVFNSYYPKPGESHVGYSEGIFLGYRGYDRAATKPLFPFGYGLSYTHFEYSHLSVSSEAGGDPAMVTVAFEIKNAGARAGAEVAEVYVGDAHSPVPRPVKELKGFAKVFLRPEESKRVTVQLNRRAFSYYDVASKQWTAQPGEFSILVGSSAEKIELKGTCRLGK